MYSQALKGYGLLSSDERRPPAPYFIPHQQQLYANFAPSHKRRVSDPPALTTE